MTVIMGAGRLPCDVMIVGGAPDKDELAKGEPFAGKVGREQEMYLSRHQLSAYQWYRTNIVKEYNDTTLTSAQVSEWAPVLEDEILQCRPKLIITVGKDATQWFLGDIAMEAVHGLPHRSDKAPDAVILPTYHPAFGFHNNDTRALISADYAGVASSLIDLQTEQLPEFAGEDEYEGKEDYRDVTGAEIERILDEFD